MLSYDSLRTVTFYLAPDLRIILASRVPMFRVTDKALPFRIQKLEISNSTLHLDNISFELGVTRFEKGKIVRKTGKCKRYCDFDKFGFQLPSAPPAQGDLNFGEDWPGNEEQTLEDLSTYKTRMERRMRGFWQVVPNIMDGKRLAEQVEYRKNNVEPPFKDFLHLTVTRGNDEFHELIEYNQNLSTALRYLNEKILGERCIPIRVQKLKVDPNGCIRLPSAVQLNVDHLRFDGSSLERLRAVLAQSSFPMKSITVSRFYEQDFEILKNAQMIVVTGFFNERLLLPFRRIHFENSSWNEEWLISKVREWQREVKDIGTHYSMLMPWFTAKQMRNSIATHPGLVVREDPDAATQQTHYRFHEVSGTFAFPLNYHSEITIRFVENQSTNSFNKACLEMKVVSTRPRNEVTLKAVSSVRKFSENVQMLIIANMEPCFRFFLKQRNPEFARLEKQAPLKIKYLTITPSSILINNTSYYIGLQRFEQRPNGFAQSQTSGGVTYDVDKYGIRVPYTPGSGDFDFGNAEPMNEENEIAALDVELTKLNQKLDDTDGELRRQLYTSQIAENRWKVERFRLRKEALEPSYKYFLYFKVCGEQWNKTETLEYQEGMFCGATKYLVRKILGGRNDPIKIENLALEAENSLLRFPEGLKMTVKKLTVIGIQNGLEIFDSILDLSGLESIGIDRIRNERDHEVLKNAEKISFLNSFKDTGVFPEFPHETLTFCYISFKHIMQIVRGWQRNAPKNGAYVKFLRESHREKNIMEKISKEERAQIGEFTMTKFGPSTNCVIFPVNNQFEIIIHLFKKNFNFDSYIRQDLHHSYQEMTAWNQVFVRIQPKGFANPLNL